ncbi:hypothetical protein L873DRAFT_1830185 [Choiromyces venosus 120613-1]|uniref:Uncharacterized protein n=1 Tax=Choiromyces venosus 120613-1 TaxID=1336337 RepID=A0A3N4J8Y5_9PEZI|nr:hypothetical protein L873DRAFT_1830185 [Choiromyces venosus 120613-1]
MPKKRTKASLSQLVFKFLETDPRPTLIASLESPRALWENEAFRTLRTRADPENAIDNLLSEPFVRESGTFDSGLWRFKSMNIGVEDIRAIIAARISSRLDINLPDWGDPRPRTFDDFQGNVGVQVEMQPRKHGIGQYEEKHADGGLGLTANFGITGNLCKALVDTGNDSPRIYFEDSEDEEEVETEMEDFEVDGTIFKACGPDGDKLLSIPTFAVSEAGPARSKLYPQLTGPSMDWIRNPLHRNSSQHLRNLGNVKWSTTPCGPLEGWSSSLRTWANSIMAMPYPTSIFWGPSYMILYNDQWVKIAQSENPCILGKGFAQGWPELQNYFMPLLNEAFHHGRSVVKRAEQLFLNRGDWIEECYFDFTISAIIGDSGAPEGVLGQAFELSRHIISIRRMETLQKMGTLMASVRDLDEDNFWGRALEAFNDNPLDSPFILIYRTLVDEDLWFRGENEYCVLEGNIGFVEGGILAPKKCDLKERSCYFANEMAQAREKSAPVIKYMDNLPQDEAILCRGFDEPPTRAAVIPIQATSSTTQGFLILGLNPRKPVDADCRLWIELLMKELSTTAGRVRLLRAEVTKAVNQEAERAARAQAIELQKQLRKRTEELGRSELLFTRIAETISVGLAILHIDGKIWFENEAYRDLTGLPVVHESDAWRESIYKGDAEWVVKSFDDAVATRSNMKIECRLGNDPSRSPGWKHWVSCSVVAQTEKMPGSEREEVTGYILTLVDITSIKLNEEYQRQQSTQAVERRRQQENFIDIFSHELRNPFSATLQCADGILSTLIAYQKGEDNNLDLEEMIDSASTILVCVQHQMRIIDDVLTLSKLDSMLLSVVPVDVQIHAVIAQLMKIFQSELHVKGITSEFILEESYQELGVDWVKADPARFSQILVAIKFTSQQAGKREITVKLGATLERPTAHGEVMYRESEDRLPQDMAQEWNTGDPVFILVTVQDSGIGINTEWQTKLFKRFEQVPRTHVTYGGSGLGLFICRRLCRIQGGEIGVHSEEGKGSSFSFYIKARQSSTAPSPSPNIAPVKYPKLLRSEMISMKDYAPPKATEGDQKRQQISYAVLIVEDNLINQEVLRRQLRKEGCVTYVAGNGQEALDFIVKSEFVNAEATKVDVILMDMEMPVMDGNTATVKIRELETSGKIRRHVPIMGISANARPEQVAKMTEVGMDDAISKPFRIADLLGRFDTLLKKLNASSGSSS